MSIIAAHAEREIINALIVLLGKVIPPPTRETVEQKAKVLATMQDFEGDLSNIIDEVLTAIDTRVGRGISIINVEEPHDNEWVKKRGDIEWIYSNAYAGYLEKNGWPPDATLATMEVGDKILGHLQDPLCEGSWDRRGLVIGHVQSGKTANYLGLVAKAADAGYRFIIVIAGIHNNLRKQTQERVDFGFIGRSSDATNPMRIGVAEFIEDYPHPITFTDVNSDFNKGKAEAIRAELKDFNKPLILIIKKNVKILEALHGWLADLSSKGGKISHTPMLMIDDEADNASVNTNKEDTDPTRTNAWLRRIIHLFEKSCYVGYTATPFANIFISPDSNYIYIDKNGNEENIRKDLFPRDFIYLLDAPNTYLGPQKIFIDDDSGNKILRKITDCEQYIPLRHKKDLTVVSIPPSLKNAFNVFVLTKAIRNARGQHNKHCSMLVNVSYIVAIQKAVKGLLQVYEKNLHQAILTNYAMPDSQALSNKYIADLYATFQKEFLACNVTWTEVKRNLASVFTTLKIMVINSSSDDVLDYKSYEQSGQGLTVVAIGGFSLSRGLTLEGLCISYMYRNTRQYDTLMQMGRWFGYRSGYEDLCRIYLHEDAIDWYGYIADKTEELRQQIYLMRRKKMSPSEFGLYVERHPDRELLITSANKMRSAIMTTVQKSYSGRIVETYLLPKQSNIHSSNEKLIQSLMQSVADVPSKVNSLGIFAKDIDFEVILDFLDKFEVHQEIVAEKNGIIKYLNGISNEYPKVDIIFRSIENNDEDLQSLKLGKQKRSVIIYEDCWKTPKARVAGRGDERIGLSQEQLIYARQLAEEYHNKDPKKSRNPSDVHFRTVRDKPLLMLHILEMQVNGCAIAGGERVPAFGLSFPVSNFGKTVIVAANKVWRDTMQDMDFEEEDIDD